MSAGAPAHDVACVAHVHSRHSDGTATVPEIAAAARAAGARAVLVTDHDTLGARAAGEDGWRDGVLVVAGYEVTPRGGHLLVFGTDELVGHAGRTEAQIARAALDAGATAFAAHPFSRGSAISTRVGRPHGWPALDPDDPPVGLEIWSLVTDAAEAWRGPRAALRFLRAPEATLEGPPARHLTAWDALGRRRRVPAIGGLDAHQPGVRRGGRVVGLMPHERWFALLQTHAVLDAPLSGEARRDEARVLAALAAGRAFLAVPAFARADGFRFWAARGGHELPMGAEADHGDWTLRVRAPRAAHLTILRDGRAVAGDVASSLHVAAREPGVWRARADLHVHGRLRPWVLTNPVYLR